MSIRTFPHPAPMPQSIRNRRRNRWRRRAYLQQLDQLALAKIRRSYLLSAASWGGQYCPSCGTPIRPHMLVDISGRYGCAMLDGCYARHPGSCIENDWMERRSIS